MRPVLWWGSFFGVGMFPSSLRFAVATLLVLAANSVDAYQAEVRQELRAQDKTPVPVRYQFEWEIYDAVLYEKSGADKAELQERTESVLKNVLQDYAGRSPKLALIRLADGEDDEQALVIAIETNNLIAELGVRLIDLEFLSIEHK